MAVFFLKLENNALGFRTSSHEITIEIVISLKFKTKFNYCSSGGGQNSVIPIVCDVPKQNHTHDMLYYQTAHKSIASYEVMRNVIFHVKR